MRITKKDLESAVSRLNDIAGTPQETYVKTDVGFKAQIGNYHLDGAYGGWKLVQMACDGGGIREITHGFISKPKMYDQIQAYIDGMVAGRGVSQ